MGKKQTPKLFKEYHVTLEGKLVISLKPSSVLRQW